MKPWTQDQQLQERIFQSMVTFLMLFPCATLKQAANRAYADDVELSAKQQLAEPRKGHD